ncbi:penicillin-binding protein activator [Marinicella litoralis]|uniref:LppC lipoprotein n=1 Tax=Marinicella litoralis TaxID=644220 RepID=A0A4R6XQX6_9GAMM|nr:penicillin-binding protein activator [Marinicella litoralis]TDR20819.1 hypothetical protein C8D91_1797 [Marinicella litoralis]
MVKLNKNILLCLLFGLFLTACGTGSGPNTKPSNNKAKTKGMELYQQQQYFLAVDYLTEAHQQLVNDQDVYVALLDSWFQLGETVRVWQLLNESTISTAETQLIEAELQQQQNACMGAISKVSEISTESLDDVWLVRYWRLKSHCHYKNAAYLSSAMALIQLNQWIDDPIEQQQNHDLIVQSLIMVDESELILAIGDIEDELTQGWIEAAYVKFGADGVSGAGWLQQWPNHPASFYFLDLNQISLNQKVAVLLPFSGRFEQVAKAVQKGLLTAALSDQNTGNELMFFDTGSAGENFATAFYSAQEYQADMIIGPLDKSSIETLEIMPEPTIPVVLLNQSESNYHQFTLSPEGEAETVAAKMIADGVSRVLIMAPNDTWGERMTQAFAQKFVDLGGQIQNNSYFQPEQNDYSAQLRQILGLVESQLRAKNLQQFLKLNLHSEEVVRSDVDAIFLAAKPSFARLMIPQLKFHRAADIPVYSSSHVFDGLNNEQHNKDLEGVKFAISPVELQSSELFESLPFDLKKIKQDRKLFAFGYDAYQLISRLVWMSRVNTGLVDGLTGKVSLDINGHFRRELLWAQYHNGSIRSISH